jgi:hypothetical protein
MAGHRANANAQSITTFTSGISQSKLSQPLQPARRRIFEIGMRKIATNTAMIRTCPMLIVYIESIASIVRPSLP